MKHNSANPFPHMYTRNMHTILKFSTVHVKTFVRLSHKVQCKVDNTTNAQIYGIFSNSVSHNLVLLTFCQ